MNSRFWKPTLIKVNLSPKNFSLGLIRPKVSFYACLGYFLYFNVFLNSEFRPSKILNSGFWKLNSNSNISHSSVKITVASQPPWRPNQFLACDQCSSEVLPGVLGKKRNMANLTSLKVICGHGNTRKDLKETRGQQAPLGRPQSS